MTGVPLAANVTATELATLAVTVSSPVACRLPLLLGWKRNKSNTVTIMQNYVIEQPAPWLPPGAAALFLTISPRWCNHFCNAARFLA